MQELSTCKHCSFQFQIGEEDGHSVEDCSDRLKRKYTVVKKNNHHLREEVNSLKCDNTDIKNQASKALMILSAHDDLSEREEVILKLSSKWLENLTTE